MCRVPPPPGGPAVPRLHADDGDGTDREAFLEDAAAQWAQIDPGRYPFVHAAATRLGEHDDREQFLVGVDIFLAGVSALG
ncbi:hypothetical protein Saso_75310 [Streptomyces asoensis]|uniref:Tetracycline repressor TetR C-terminal domain-containing protein n=1 Tax=Streptomyces asoensis TaxID=249586 RepID=A0ABQ3SCM4_9ACTN|nr:hypothetical protein GCM10010496_64540 [Streptomyces asoensis]GHI65881.1 hypothetical protein Saso_75310 [Streptomyces asoensis]